MGSSRPLEAITNGSKSAAPKAFIYGSTAHSKLAQNSALTQRTQQYACTIDRLEECARRHSQQRTRTAAAQATSTLCTHQAALTAKLVGRSQAIALAQVCIPSPSPSPSPTQTGPQHMASFSHRHSIPFFRHITTPHLKQLLREPSQAHMSHHALPGPHRPGQPSQEADRHVLQDMQNMHAMHPQAPPQP
jgi:hypothetical protein